MTFSITLVKLALILVPSYWLCRQSVPLDGPGRRVFLFGLSGIVSMLLLGAIMWALLVTTGQILPWVAVMVLIFVCLILGFVIKRIRGDACALSPEVGQKHDAPSSPQARLLAVLTWVLAGLIVLRLGTWLPDVLLRPVFGWDAWIVWAYEARLWLEQGRFVPLLEPDMNLMAGRDEWVRSNTALYPRLLPALMLWVASAGDAWTGVGPGLLWWMVCFYSVFLLVGTFKLLGYAPIWSLLLAYVWISLPMVSAHASLYGYADLWVGVVLGMFACLMVLQERTESRALLWLAVLILLFLPMIKVEGFYWLIICLFSLLLRFYWLGLRKIVGLAVLGIGFVLMLWVIGFDLINWATAGRLSLRFDDLQLAMAGLIRHTFYWYDWHVLFYAVVAAFLIALIRPMWVIRFRAVTAVCLLGLILLGLFLPMTGAGDWLDQGTLFSRVSLQLSMVLVMFGLLIIQAFWGEQDCG